jgi:hypothetical protein
MRFGARHMSGGASEATGDLVDLGVARILHHLAPVLIDAAESTHVN